MKPGKESRRESDMPFEMLAKVNPAKTREFSQTPTPINASYSFEHFMDHIPIPIIVVDRSNKIRFINSAAAAISSDYHAVLDEDISRLFPRQSDYLGVKVLLENMPRRGHAQIRQEDIRIISKNVNCRIFLSSTNISGEELTILAVEDCELLHKFSILSEDRQTLVAAVPAGIAQFELLTPISLSAPLRDRTVGIMSARLKTANNEFARMHGFTVAEELLGALASEFVQPSSPIDKAFRYWIEQGLPLYRTTLYSDSLNGKRAPVEVALAANISDDRVISYWIVERSLEERQEMQALFESVGGRFQTVFERVDELILMKDLDSRYLEVNPAAQRLLGLDSDAIKGKKPEEVWGAKTGEKIRECDIQALKGITTDQIFTISRGGRTTVRLTSTPMRDLAGNIIGLFEIGQLVQNPWPTSKASGTDFSSKRKERFPVCRSDAMRKTLETVWVAAKTEGMILLSGETGSGKDFLARLIHESSARAARPFIAINCASLPLDLAESELFGHEPGAFTGAKRHKKGMLELAHGGTLFMNEISDLPLTLQAKLLTFLDTNSFCRVGGTKQITVDARILAATNRSLSEDVADGRFRKDLFYRLNVLSIVVPPLRERKEDLSELAKHILSDLAGRNEHSAVPELTPSVMSALLDYHWPGNVRELKSVMNRLLLSSEIGDVTTQSLGLDDASRKWAIETHFPENQTLNEVLDEVKCALIEEALKRTAGKRKAAACLLGISRNSLKHHMRALSERRRIETKVAAGLESGPVAANDM